MDYQPILTQQNLQSKTEQQKRLEQQFRKRKFYEAHNQLSRFDIMLSMIKMNMQGSQQEKQEQLRKRISKFFDYGDKSIDLGNEYFCERREPNCNAQSIPHQLIFYGVDFMSIKAFRKRFGKYEPKINRMDDSHYKAVFKNEQDAYRAIQQNIKDKTILKVKAQEQQSEVSKAWFQLLPYYQLGYQRKLFCRHATSDQNQGSFQQSQKMQLYKKAKKQIEEKILSQGKRIYCQEKGKIFNRNRKYGNTQRIQRINRQRSRSRDKNKSNRYENSDFKRRDSKKRGATDFPDVSQMKSHDLNDINDDEEQDDNFDFVLSPQQLNQLGKQFQGMQLNDKISEIGQKSEIFDPQSANLEYQLYNNSMNQSNTVNRRAQEDLDLDEQNQEPVAIRDNINTDWSYKDYIAQQQMKQQRKKQQKRSKVIVLD